MIIHAITKIIDTTILDCIIRECENNIIEPHNYRNLQRRVTI